MKKILLIVSIMLTLLVACEGKKEKTNTPSMLKLATTTSTRDSGLLAYLLPYFSEDTGIEVKVIAVGTGKAIELGRSGDVSALLVHDTESENKVVQDGFADARYDVMYNDFILLGPIDSTKKLPERFSKDIVGALEYILTTPNTSLISRGDDSGTHKMELRLIKEAGIENLSDLEEYLSVGSGMSNTIGIASELQGFTLSDRATYLKMKDVIDLEPVVQGDPKLFNQYGVLVITNNDSLDKQAADIFKNWILSLRAQELIGIYGIEEFNEPLFIPNAKK